MTRGRIMSTFLALQALFPAFAAPPSEEGFEPLFNGRDLAGWVSATGWSVDRGTIVFDGHGFESLVSEDSFEDFELRLQWRIEPGGDSGIYLRGCPQVQIWDRPIGSGGLFNNKDGPANPRVAADRPPGSWNAFRIRMVGDTVTVWLNGMLVVDAVRLENHGDRSSPVPRTGPVWLQGHDSPLAFRNLRLKRLPPGASLDGLDVETPAEHDARMAWWREARFGLFIHWGLYAIPAGEWKGETRHAEWIRTTARIPLETYDEFRTRFDPVAFDADAWVRAAKRAGMRYVVITSKHHDGFCLFDSAHTDFDVMSTSFGRDIMAELAEACRRHGLRMCWYHSIMDWHHPDYLPRRGWEEDRSAEGAEFGRFVSYLHGQVEELLTNYGDIGVLWFDGEWERTWTRDLGNRLYALCRRLQPDLVINNRVGGGRVGMSGLDEGPGFAGDFGTPEQEIPDKGLPGVDWETCMTMNRFWGWNRADEDWKSSWDLIRKLADIASKGGNFLLNIGPTALGEFPPKALERLEAIGAWMDVHAESIHGTSASPFPSLAWGCCTRRSIPGGTRLYLHVFDWPADGRLVVPGIGNEVTSARLLAEPDGSLAVRREGTDLVIDLPGIAPHPADTVVALDVAGDPVVYETPVIEAASDVLVDRLEVSARVGSGQLVLRYTLDGRDPTLSDPVLDAPVVITGSCTIAVRAFHEGAPVSTVAIRAFERVTPHPALPATTATVEGLDETTWEGTWEVLPDLDALAPARRAVVPAPVLPGGPAVEHVARRFAGFLAVPASDVWTFAVRSDDGARLWIGEVLVVDNDGLHGDQERRGTIALAEGRHPIRVEWFNRTGNQALDVRWARAGAPLAPIPTTSFSRSPVQGE